MPGSNSSSSDEEEDLRIKQLREVAVSFDSLKQVEKDEKPSSKRHQDCEDDPNFFEVSPQFQEFVAKKLRKKLDESIELITNSPKTNSKKKLNDEDHKFQLLKNVYLSHDFLLETKNNNANKIIKQKKYKKSAKDESDSENENLDMLKEAAIDVSFLAKTTCIQDHKDKFLSKN